MIKKIATAALVVGMFPGFIGLLWDNTPPDQRQYLPPEVIAYACDIDTDEFVYMAQVIEAESDRTAETTPGKIAIAAVILNRVSSEEFPDTITGVLNQPGQFSTTHNGICNTEATQTAYWAIYEAQQAIANGDLPDNLLYFNCIGYQYGTAYDYIGGNYFSLG